MNAIYPLFKRIVPALAVFILLIITPSCIQTMRVPFVRDSLDRPEVFQKKYGDHPQAVIYTLVPNDLWKDVTLRKWSFTRTLFEYTRFENVTFDTVIFDNCEFRKLIVKNCRFINCRFVNCTVSAGRWEKSSFRGGEIDTMMFTAYGPSGNDYWYPWLEWADLEFDSMRIIKWWPHNHSGRMDRPRFTNVEISDSDFIYMNINYPVFRGCVLRGNHFTNRSEDGIHNADMENCMLENNGPYVMLAGRFKKMKIMEDVGIEMYGSAEDVEVYPTKRVIIAKTERLTVHGPISELLSINDCKDSTIGEVKGNFFLYGECSGITFGKVSGSRITFGQGTIRNCTFNGLECDIMDLDRVTFERCTIRDAFIRKKISIYVKPVFTDCTVSNFRRDSGVKFYEYSTDPPIDYNFPWETSPDAPTRD